MTHKARAHLAEADSQSLGSADRLRGSSRLPAEARLPRTSEGKLLKDKKTKTPGEAGNDERM